MPADTSRNWLAVAGLVLATLLWGSSFVAMKLAFQVYHPMVVVAGRMVVASLCFLALWPRFRHIRVRPADRFYLVLIVLFEPCLYFLFEAGALTYTSASQAGVIVALLPVMVVVSAGIFLREKMTPWALSGLAAAVVGAIGLSLSAGTTLHAPAPLLGNFLEFLAMVCATAYTLLTKRLTRDYPPLFITALQAFGGSVFFLPFLLLPGVELPHTFEPLTVLAIVYLGAGITLGAYGLYNYALSRFSAGRVSVFINLIPVFTVMLGFILLGERFTPGQFAASVLILAGVIISQWDEFYLRRKRLRSQPKEWLEVSEEMPAGNGRQHQEKSPAQPLQERHR